jgi:hypothetical protein
MCTTEFKPERYNYVKKKVENRGNRHKAKDKKEKHKTMTIKEYLVYGGEIMQKNHYKLTLSRDKRREMSFMGSIWNSLLCS